MTSATFTVTPPRATFVLTSPAIVRIGTGFTRVTIAITIGN